MIDEFPSIISCLSRRVKIKVCWIEAWKWLFEAGPCPFQKRLSTHRLFYGTTNPVQIKKTHGHLFIVPLCYLFFFCVSSRRQTVYCCGTWPFEARCPSWHHRDPPGIEHRTSWLNDPSMPYLLLRSQFPSCANLVSIYWVIHVYLISCVNGNLG